MKELNKCKNCRHYKNNTQNVGHIYDCNNPKFKYGYYETVEDMEKDEILIEDDEGWGLIIGEEFGCIHFEEKTNNNI